MKRLTLLFLAALAVFSFARSCPAQEAMPPDEQEQSAAMPDNDQEQTAAMPDDEAGGDADEAVTYGCMCQDCMDKGMCGKMGMKGMSYRKMGMGGMACGKMGMKGKMAMMGRMAGGMPGMHGDIDRMTWPPMNRSCRTPEFYLQRAEGLGLSGEQVASLGKLAASLRKEQILKGAAVKALELDLSEIVTKTDFRLDDAMDKLAEIEKARTELRSRVLRYSSDARDILSPQQLEKVKELGVRRCYNCGLTMPGMEERNPGAMKQKMMDRMRREMMNK